MTHKKTYQIGKWAEWRAGLYLRLRGYKIIAKRLRTPMGEIDILAQKNGVWIVAEVKYRPTTESSKYSISDHQKHRLINASLWVMNHYTLPQDTDFRFDAILLSPKTPIQHIKNAWQADH